MIFGLKWDDYVHHLNDKAEQEDDHFATTHIMSALAVYFYIMLGLTQLTKFLSIAIEVRILSKYGFDLDTEAIQKIRKRICFTNIFTGLFAVVETVFVGMIIN
jgi:hypothetical protein